MKSKNKIIVVHEKIYELKIKQNSNKQKKVMLSIREVDNQMSN